jgi:hypothetical protein
MTEKKSTICTIGWSIASSNRVRKMSIRFPSWRDYPPTLPEEDSLWLSIYMGGRRNRYSGRIVQFQSPLSRLKSPLSLAVRRSDGGGGDSTVGVVFLPPHTQFNPSGLTSLSLCHQPGSKRIFCLSIYSIGPVCTIFTQPNRS